MQHLLVMANENVKSRGKGFVRRRSLFASKKRPMDVSNPAKELEWVCALDEEEVRRSYCSCRCDVVNFAREGVPSPPTAYFFTQKNSHRVGAPA